MPPKRWMTVLSDFTWPKKQIRADRVVPDCSPLSAPPRRRGALALSERYSRIVNEAVLIKQEPAR